MTARDLSPYPEVGETVRWADRAWTVVGVTDRGDVRLVPSEEAVTAPVAVPVEAIERNV